jgi:two-component system sensor histidine kinase KdpD
MAPARLRRKDAFHLGLSLAGIFAVVGLLRAVGHINPTTAAVGMLVTILVTAASARLAVAIVTSLTGMLALNFFFYQPLYTLTLSDPENWTALIAFLIVSVVASQLSAAAQARTREAVERRNELNRLLDFSRDVLLTTEGPDALGVLAARIANRFALKRVALCRPRQTDGWEIRDGGEEPLVIDDAQLNAALERTGSHTLIPDPAGGHITLVPIRLGRGAIGLLAANRGYVEGGTLDAIGGLLAIAMERSEFLSERRAAALVRQRADLVSALFASLSHDLRTPLTAMSVAVENLQNRDLCEDQRRAQAQLAAQELDRLKRLFQDILDMARIDAATLAPEVEWVTAADVIDAALANLGPSLAARPLEIDADGDSAVAVDPRLTSSALSHVIENAVRYSPADRPIVIQGWVDPEGLHLAVRDHGPGLDPDDLDRMFERFYRGKSTQGAGTGMGLAITRGLLAAEDGRVWGENADGGGARFSIVVPGMSDAAVAVS